MTAPGPPPPRQGLAVRGGSGGITANRDALDHLAGTFRTAAAAVSGEVWLVGGLRSRLDLDLFGGGDTAWVDLVGMLRARELVDDAIAHLSRGADEIGGLARGLRNAVQGYPWGTDALDVGLLQQLDALLGGLGTGTVDGHGSLTGGTDLVAGQDPHLVDLGLGLVGVPQLAELGRPDDDSPGVAVPIGTLSVAAPRGLPDLVRALGDVDSTGTPGGIDVRVLTGPDGRRSVVVDITGTRTWGAGGRNVADLPTNQLALLGRRTAYEDGVLAAMRQAGVRRDDDVMLVGHSQGGMVAVTTARDAVRTGEFHVTHVVTAGSPIGLTVGRLPPSVRVLALENGRDLVPRLDTSENPDRRNVVTVSGPYGDGTVGGGHSVEASYEPLAVDTARSGSRSVRDFLAGAAHFFGATHAVQHSYRVERR